MDLDNIKKEIESLKKEIESLNGAEKDKAIKKLYDLEREKRCLTGKAGYNEFDNFMKGFMRCGL